MSENQKNQRPPEVRKRAVRDIPEMKGKRPDTATSGRRPAPKRDIPQNQRALQRRDEASTSLVQLFKKNALMRSRKKDAEWEATPIVRQRHGVDRPMLVIILILLCLGTVMVFSASYPNALHEKNDSLYYIKRQLLYVAIGALAMLITTAAPYQLYKKIAPSFTIGGIGLLVLVLIMGTARGVAQRWIYIGPISVQASEPAKAALIITLAWYLDKHYDAVSGRINKYQRFMKGIVMPGVIVAVFAGLVILEKHLSGAIILGLIGVAVIFMSGADFVKMLLSYGIPAGLAGLVYLFTNDYAMQRILTHRDDNADVLAEAWQTTQGLYAIGSGGLLGMGLGESNLKYNYVSEAHNDFIFTIWCEELGLVGALLLICLYGFFVWRGMTIARKAPDTFSSLAAFGITFQVGIQAALNILVVTDLIPNTGVSLPFFSYGGSALIIIMAEMGILLSISRHSYQKK